MELSTVSDGFVPPADWERIASRYEVCPYCYEAIKYQLTHRASEHMLHMLDEWGRHVKSRKCLMFKKTTTHDGNGAYAGAFAFTITQSPQDAFSIGDMLTAVRKVMSQRSKKVVKYAWYYEDKGQDALGTPLHPHIHGMYETENGGRIEAKHWMRAWPIWDEKKPMGAGFRGGYHRPVRHGEAYESYIKKDGGLSESRGMD